MNAQTRTTMYYTENRTRTLDGISEIVTAIADTENTYEVNEGNYDVLSDVERFSDYGLQTYGRMIGFPAKFLVELNESNPDLASDVINDRAQNYFNKEKPKFFAREFLNKVQGVVSNKYAYFDDKEVIQILETSILKDMKYSNTIITPERLHLRAIEPVSFKLENDDSPLFFCYFIDNSMVGQSSFKVRIGLYRLACTNGLIVPCGDNSTAVLCKQVHRGYKDIAAEFNMAMNFLQEKKDNIKEILLNAEKTTAKIEELNEEYRVAYLAKKLNLNNRESERVIEIYQTVYNGKSRWDMVNAITEFARDVEDINRREFLESKALEVA